MTSQIQNLIANAEAGEDWAEICRLEAEQVGGPFYCPTCGVGLSADDTSPCSLEYGVKCGIEELRRQRDDAAAMGDFGEALNLNDRILRMKGKRP